MKHLAKLVREVYESTKVDRIKWEPSSSQGAYYCKIGNTRLEIVNPSDRNLAAIAGDQLVRQHSIFDSPIRRTRIADISDYRLIVYKPDGRMDFEVGPAMINISEYSDLNMDPRKIFAAIYRMAKSYDSAHEEIVVNEILNSLKRDSS